MLAVDASVVHFTAPDGLTLSLLEQSRGSLSLLWKPYGCLACLFDAGRAFGDGEHYREFFDNCHSAFFVLFFCWKIIGKPDAGQTGEMSLSLLGAQQINVQNIT